jgi:hypothetical protein
VQAPAPTRPIYRGMFGPSLIAHILVSKFDDHLPLYRQGEIFARLGADIPRSTLIDGCGAGIATLRPLSDLIKAEIFRTDRLHVDDTPIKVLDLSRKSADPMTKGVKEGRIWVYVRDDRPWGGGDPPCVPSAPGAKLSSHASLEKAIWPGRCVTLSIDGRRSRFFSTMAASRSTTMRRSAPSSQ